MVFEVLMLEEDFRTAKECGHWRWMWYLSWFYRIDRADESAFVKDFEKNDRMWEIKMAKVHPSMM